MRKKAKRLNHGSINMRIEWETQTVELDCAEYRMLLGEEWEPCGVWKDDVYYADRVTKVVTMVLLKRKIRYLAYEPYSEVSQSMRDTWTE